MSSWFLYLHRYSWGVIKPELKMEFGLTDTQLGWLDSVFNGAYALCQVPTGLLGDLLGPGIVLPVMIAAWSGLAAAPVAGVGFWSFAGLRAVFGVAQAGCYPNLGKVTRNWFPPSIRTVLQGLVASFSGRSGGACASIIVGTVLLGWLGYGWRAALCWIAVAGVAFAIVFRWLFRDSPAQHPWTNEAERRLIGAAEPSGATPRSKPRFDLSPASLVSFSFLLLAMFSSAFADILYVYWIPLFLEEAKGLDKIEMGIFASLPLWTSAVGGVVGGILNDVLIRLRGRRFARSAVGFTGKLMAAVLVVATFAVDDGRWIMVVLAGAKFFTDWCQPTMWGTCTDIGGSATGRAFGTVNMFGSFGAFAAGPVLGSIKESFGWGVLFWTIAGTYLLSASCWLMVDASRRLYVEEPEERR
jgi:sugar phosphate permease